MHKRNIETTYFSARKLKTDEKSVTNTIPETTKLNILHATY